MNFVTPPDTFAPNSRLDSIVRSFAGLRLRKFQVVYWNTLSKERLRYYGSSSRSRRNRRDRPHPHARRGDAADRRRGYLAMRLSEATPTSTRWVGGWTMPPARGSTCPSTPT